MSDSELAKHQAEMKKQDSERIPFDKTDFEKKACDEEPGTTYNIAPRSGVHEWHDYSKRIYIRQINGVLTKITEHSVLFESVYAILSDGRIIHYCNFMSVPHDTLVQWTGY